MLIQSFLSHPLRFGADKKPPSKKRTKAPAKAKKPAKAAEPVVNTPAPAVNTFVPKSGGSGLSWAFERPQATELITGSKGHKTQVTTLIDGGQIFGALDKVLNNAKKTVYVDVYALQNSKVKPDRACPPGTPGADQQQKILDKLVELKNKGLTVKVIVDNSLDMRTKKRNNAETLEFLKQNKVDVLTYPDSANINHIKLLIVDDQFAVIGGMNWGNHSPTNHDASILLEGDAVGNLVDQIFHVDWAFSGGDVSKLPKAKPIPEDRIKVLTTTPAESPDGGQNEIFSTILNKIDNAKHSVVAELFTLTDKIVAERLIKAHERLTKAGQPGVKILVDPGLYFRFKNCRPVVDMLKEKGIPIKFYKVDWSKEEKLHGKWAIFDEESILVGSANWSRLGLKSNPVCKADEPCDEPPITNGNFYKTNHEAGLMIDSPDLAKAFTKQFFYDWFKKATPMWGAKGIFRDIPEPVKAEMFPDFKSRQAKSNPPKEA